MEQTTRSVKLLALAKTRTAMTSYLNQHVGQSGAAAVYFKLEENGVKVVNGYSGGAVLPLLDQFHPTLLSLE